MFKREIVKFVDGHYAIRKRWIFGYRYLFLPDTNGRTWESFNSDLFSFCKTKNLDEIITRIDYGTPI